MILPGLKSHAAPASSLARALIVTRRELRDTLRDWRIVTPIVTLMIFIPLLLAFVLRVAGPDWVERLGSDVFYNKLLPFSMLAIGFLPMSFCLVIALETFVGEKERNSLEALLSAPLTDLELFLGKYIASVIPPIIASALASLSFGLFISLFSGVFPVSLDLLLIFSALNTLEAMVMVAASVLVSTHTTSVRAANIMASFIIMPMSIVVQLEALLIISGHSYGLLFMLVGLLIILLLLMRSGVRIFNREEIVAREGDNISFKGIWRGFAYFFKRTPFEAMARQQTGRRWTLWRLYRHDIPQIVRLNRGATITIVIAITAAILLTLWISTWSEAATLRGQLGFEQRANASQNPICQAGGVSNMSVGNLRGISWDKLFMNNTTAVLIGSFLSLLTLGVAGILLLMISIGPIGFIAGFLVQANINPVPLLAGFLIPHGILELSAALIGIAAAMRMGNAIIAPPTGMTVGQGFQFALVNYLKVLALVIPLLLVAAIVEANVTPAIGCWLTGGKL